MIDTFTLMSEELGGNISPRFVHKGCGGDNISPQFSWVNAPVGTKSFALVMHDLDCPTPSGFWHWVVVDIPAGVSSIATGAGNEGGELPEGAMLTINDSASVYYSGCYPPPGHGYHAYTFTLYALDCETLGVEPNTPAGGVAFDIWCHTLAKCSVVGYYQNL